MTIDFSCPRCGTPFKVDVRLAGKKGRCKKCGHQMRIPAESPAAAAAVATGIFRLSADHLGGAATATAEAPPESVKRAGRKRPVSSLKLVPISEDFLKPLARRRQEELEESNAEAGYKLAARSLPDAPLGQIGHRAKPPGALQRFYGTQMGKVFRLLRKANDFAYLISVPFMLLLLVAVVLKQRNLAIVGAAGVILPNIARLAINAFNLAIVPFRVSPIHGVLFFIPPLTFYYLYKYWNLMKQTALRVVGPAATILAVVLVFVFVPWLSGGGTGQDAAIGERIKSEAGALGDEIKEGVKRGVEAVEKATEDEV